MGCHYCGWGTGRHSPDCPKPDSREMMEWKTGNADARAEMPSASNDVHYRMGYLRGEVALEEAQNGHDPRFA